MSRNSGICSFLIKHYLFLKLNWKYVIVGSLYTTAVLSNVLLFKLLQCDLGCNVFCHLFFLCMADVCHSVFASTLVTLDLARTAGFFLADLTNLFATVTVVFLDCFNIEFIKFCMHFCRTWNDSFLLSWTLRIEDKLVTRPSRGIWFPPMLHQVNLTSHLTPPKQPISGTSVDFLRFRLWQFELESWPNLTSCNLQTARVHQSTISIR